MHIHSSPRLEEQYAGEAGPERRREGKGDDGTVGGVTHASTGTLSVKMLRLEFLIAKPTLRVKPNLNLKLTLSMKPNLSVKPNLSLK